MTHAGARPGAHWLVFAAAVVLHLGCSFQGSADPAARSAGLQGKATAASGPQAGHLRKAQDQDPDPDVVRYTLVAAPKKVRLRPGGPKTQLWVYNGGTPGPLLEGEVGDRMIVHFENHLPEETTIHWHGMDVPADMDGSHIAQGAVPPGGSFTYEFELTRPGTYWYHPHVRSHEQVEQGLYGPLVVHDPEVESRIDPPRRSMVMMLDDVLLDEQGELEETWPDDPVQNAERQINGREGNMLLVNGRHLPTVPVRNGKPIRLRLVNAANARFMRVSLPGHSMHRLGAGSYYDEPVRVPPIDMIPVDHHDEHGGGHGGHGGCATGAEQEDAYERPALRSDPDPDKGILLSPGERADVVVTPTGANQQRLTLQWHDFPRGRHEAHRCADGEIALSHAEDDGLRKPKPLTHFRLVGRAADTRWTPPERIADVAPINVSNAAGTLPLPLGHTHPDRSGDVTFFATIRDGRGIPFDELTVEDALHARVGQTYIWEVTNLTMGDHNFHPHGFPFQILEIEYIDDKHPERNRVVTPEVRTLRDTMRIPARPGAQGSSRTVARLAVHFGDEGREGQVEAYGKTPAPGHSGGWFVHCHVLEHAARGMGSFLNLREP
jgi:FtsP/CotA-like multicopper oxidase with cupredoxin domain